MNGMVCARVFNWGIFIYLNMVLAEEDEEFFEGNRSDQLAEGPGLDVKELARCFTDPIIVYPGWKGCLPAGIKEDIPIDRLRILCRKEDEGECTDLEAMAYLYTAILARGMDPHWVNIWINLVKLCAERKNIHLEITPYELSLQEKRMFVGLKRWIRRQQRERAGV